MRERRKRVHDNEDPVQASKSADSIEVDGGAWEDPPGSCRKGGC